MILDTTHIVIYDTVRTAVTDTLHVVTRDGGETLSKFESRTIMQQWIWIAVTGIGLAVAIWQLRIASLASLLQVELMIFDSLQRIDDIAAESQAITGRFLNNPRDEAESRLMLHRSATQNHLNALDRLCGCIRRKLISERHARPEYESMVNTALHEMKLLMENSYKGFDFSKAYPNILALGKKWGLI